MQDGDDIIDPKLSAQYRELADERAPESLNRAVLRVASKSTGWRLTGDWLAERFKPAAYIVMVALSLAVILEFNEVGILTPSFLTEEQVPGADNSGSIFQDAGDTAAEQIREATSAANNAMQNSGSGDVLAEDMSAGSNPVTLLPEHFNCDSAQRRTMTTWWQCIQSLESRGASAAAEQELAELVATFPDFVKPD